MPYPAAALIIWDATSIRKQTAWVMSFEKNTYSLGMGKVNNVYTLLLSM